MGAEHARGGWSARGSGVQSGFSCLSQFLPVSPLILQTCLRPRHPLPLFVTPPGLGVPPSGCAGTKGTPRQGEDGQAPLFLGGPTVSPPTPLPSPGTPRWSSTHLWSLGHPTACGISAGKRGTREIRSARGWGLTLWGARSAGTRRPLWVLAASAAPGVGQCFFPFLPRHSTPVLDGEQKLGWQGGHGVEQRGGHGRVGTHGTVWPRSAHRCPIDTRTPKHVCAPPAHLHTRVHPLTDPCVHMCTRMRPSVHTRAPLTHVHTPYTCRDTPYTYTPYTPYPKNSAPGHPVTFGKCHRGRGMRPGGDVTTVPPCHQHPCVPQATWVGFGAGI